MNWHSPVRSRFGSARDGWESSGLYQSVLPWPRVSAKGRGTKGRGNLVPGLSLGAITGDRNNDDQGNQGNEVKFFEQTNQSSPIASKKIAHAADGDGPQHRPGEVEQQEAPVPHQKSTGEWSRQNPEARNEPGHKDGPMPVLQEKGLRAVKPCRREQKRSTVSLQQGRSAHSPDEIPEAVADRGAGYGSHNGPAQGEFAVKRQKPREEQDGLPRHGEPSVLDH